MHPLSTGRQEALRSATETLIQAAKLPGAVVAVARGDETPLVQFSGADGDGMPLTRDTLAPVASLTKLGTALSVLRLVGAGELRLDDELARHVPGSPAAVPGMTLRRLLSHTAGLPGDLAPELAPYDPDLTWTRLAEACLATPTERQPGEAVVYSNVGYGLLAVVVERQTGARFPEALRRLVLDPLGIEAYLAEEPPRPVGRIAGTRSEHLGTPLEPYHSPFWRALGMPWAGLVTTIDGAMALERAFLGQQPRFLDAELLAEARRDQTNGVPSGMPFPFTWPRAPWGLGVELRGAKRPHWAPVEASPDSFGHAGASGCLTWSDPTVNLTWTLIGFRDGNNGWLFRRAQTFGAAVLSGCS